MIVLWFLERKKQKTEAKALCRLWCDDSVDGVDVLGEVGYVGFEHRQPLVKRRLINDNLLSDVTVLAHIGDNRIQEILLLRIQLVP